MEQVQALKEKADKIFAKYPVLVDLEAKSGLEKTYIVLIGLVLFGAVLFGLGGAVLLVSLIGFVYPAYMSFKALNSPQADDDTQWLTYWVVYAFFNLFEQIASFIMSWIPFYFFIKVAILLWLYLPQTLGANVVYHKLIKPHVLPLIHDLDKALAGEAAKKK